MSLWSQSLVSSPLQISINQQVHFANDGPILNSPLCSPASCQLCLSAIWCSEGSREWDLELPAAAVDETSETDSNVGDHKIKTMT